MEKNNKLGKVIPVFKTIFPIIGKKYPFYFIVKVVEALLNTAAPFVGILFTPKIIDELCNERDLKKIFTYVAILIVSEAFIFLTGNLFHNKAMKYQEKINNHFQYLLSQHAMELDFQLTEDKNALDQMEKAKSGLNWYGGIINITNGFFKLVEGIVKTILVVGLIARKAPVILIFVVVYVVVSTFLMEKQNRIQFENYGNLSKLNRMFDYFGWALSDFKYGKDIRLYNSKKMMVDRWNKFSSDSVGLWAYQAEQTLPYQLVNSICSILRTVLTTVYVGYLAIEGQISIGIFTQMVEAAGTLDASFGGIIWNSQDIIQKCSYAYEFIVFMNYPEVIKKGNLPVKKQNHLIEFRNVSFSYPGTTKKVLDNVNIIITPGQKLSIVGLNGAGKTTFIKLLCRLYDPGEGEILLDGINIKEYDYKDYMTQFAPVFQDFATFGFEIGENIILKPNEEMSDADKKTIEDYIKLIELDKMVEKQKKGIETYLYRYFDEEGIDPSGGEKQKIAIARALAKQSPIIILDEPTAALDPVAEYEIYKQFDTLVGGKTAFYISHRLSSCRFCDKIAVFSEGKIAEYGNHDELVTKENGIYARMFDSQAQYYR